MIATTILPTCAPRDRPARRGDGSAFANCRSCYEPVHLAEAVEALDGSMWCLPCGRVAFAGTSAESMIEGALLAPEGSRR